MTAGRGGRAARRARFRCSAAGGGRAAERHRTLRAVVDWSYDLLDEPERRVFDRLAVFAGGFPLAAAERVCAGDGRTPDRVADLLGLASSISRCSSRPRPRGRATRYALLETLRAYGRDRLAERGETARCLPGARRNGAAGTPSPPKREHRAPTRRAGWTRSSPRPTTCARPTAGPSATTSSWPSGCSAPLFWYAEFRTAEMLDWAQRTVEAADRAAFTHPVGAENRVTVSDQRLRGWPT